MNVSNPCNIYNSQLSLHGEGKTRDRVNEFEGSQTPQAKHLVARNSEPLPLAKRDETLPCALFLFIGKCMEMIV